MVYIPDRCLLRNLLQHRGMSQKDLADRLNMSRQQIQNYISGRRRMSLSVAYSISHVLDCEIHELYEWKAVKE